MTAIAELVVAAPVEPWTRIGLRVEDGRARIGSVGLRFVDGAAGVVGWGLRDLPDPVAAIDGLVTHEVTDVDPSLSGDHPLGIVGFDHLVVLTSSLERTSAAIESATGEPLKRVREAGSVRQGFHRLGELIVEVVERPDNGGGEASFWGFVWTVEDIHGACASLGPDVVSGPKPAVQPGRFIASFRESVGLCLPLAIMSPNPPRREQQP